MGPINRVVLIGFMGAGKTSVGSSLAAKLGWEFVDSDVDVERVSGLDIPALFAQQGEPAFREMEKAAVERAASRTDVVIATGGGWADRIGALESLPTGTYVVWLQVDPEESLRRLGPHSNRPLLLRPDALTFAQALLRSRAKRYALAHHTYDTASATPDEIAADICVTVRSLNDGRQVRPSRDTDTSIENE